MIAQSLQIVFELDRPMRIPENPIHLDALLAWAVVDEATEAGHPDPWSVQHDLPLERHDTAAGWCWKSSMLVADPAGVQFMVNRSRGQDGLSIAQAHDVLLKAQNVLPQGSGRYKQFLLSDPFQWIKTLTAWCISNDPERVEVLLRRIRHIGKLRVIGAGHVRECHVSPHADSERWKLRAMPEPLPGYRPVHGALHAPYWDRSARTVTYMPGEGVAP